MALSWSSQPASVSSARNTQTSLDTFVVLMSVERRATAECLTVQSWHTVSGEAWCVTVRETEVQGSR